jgi:hypothetical protein
VELHLADRAAAELRALAIEQQRLPLHDGCSAIWRFIAWNIASAPSPRRLCSSGVMSGTSAKRFPRRLMVTMAGLRASPDGLASVPLRMERKERRLPENHKADDAFRGRAVKR